MKASRIWARATSRLGELTEEDLGGVPSGEEGRLDVAGVGLEVAGEVGVVGDEGGVAVEVLALGLPVEDLGDHGLGLVQRGGGKPSDGEVGEEIVPVEGGESGVGGGPDVGGLLEEEGHGRRLGGGVEAPGVVVGVTEEEDVAGRGTSPLVVGEGEEVADGLAETCPPPKEEAISSREAAKVVRPWDWRRSRRG